ncbi:MAG: AAC(3) family N-acetyltransferase [Lachnospiraceae bacterium]|nr:AAC(3) family N-acetyltransferase [Lachnospiraceae bacterium]
MPKSFGLNKGDTVWISSDAKRLLYSAIEKGEKPDLNELIDGIIDIIGEEGTILIPTFNWDFCKGKTFDIDKTPCKTGILGKAALKRDDFLRTAHPIYSFAVWGREAQGLAALNNKSSFGIDSPFTFCRSERAKNVFIDVECQHSFTFVHYVEEQTGVPYRYLKDFTSGYIDKNRFEDTRTYSMYVRDLEKDVFVTIFPLEEEFREAGLSWRYEVNEIPMKTIIMGPTYEIIERYIRDNKSRKICTYLGQ